MDKVEQLLRHHYDGLQHVILYRDKRPDTPDWAVTVDYSLHEGPVEYLGVGSFPLSALSDALETFPFEPAAGVRPLDERLVWLLRDNHQSLQRMELRRSGKPAGTATGATWQATIEVGSIGRDGFGSYPVTALTDVLEGLDIIDRAEGQRRASAPTLPLE